MEKRMIGHLGVLLGLTLLIVLALRGINILIASLLSAAVVAGTNGQQLAEALAGNYSIAMFRFAQMFFLLFLTGAVFGRVMGNSKAATSIASALTRLLGEKRTLLVLMLASAFLTYGGVNVFIVVFTMYPLGLSLLQRANVPKRLFAAAVWLGGGTFTMTAMPGSPSIHNNIPAGILKTSLSAGWGLGLIASGIMLVLGLAYIERERKKAVHRNEGFEPHPLDPLPKQGVGSTAMPHWFRASLPLAVVVISILAPQWILRFMRPAPALGEADSAFGSLVRFSQEQPLFWTSLALTLGIIVALVLFRNYRDRAGLVLSRGAEEAALPLLNTAAVIGFGGVVQSTAIFGAFESVMVDSGLNPVVSAVIAVNVFAGIAGSASGGLGIFMETMATHYMDAGVTPEIIHRLSAIASGGLDSLPHCGAVITFLTVSRLTHKQAYKEIAVVTVIIPLIALVVVTAIAIATG
jgi:H+/gluconate symporter-like permease